MRHISRVMLILLVAATVFFGGSLVHAQLAQAASCDQRVQVGVPSTTFFGPKGSEDTVYAYVYEYATYIDEINTYVPCGTYFASVKICASSGAGFEAAGQVWMYNSGGTYLASTASPTWAVGEQCTPLSGYTNTVASSTGIKVKLGENYEGDTAYPFPASGTYHLQPHQTARKPGDDPFLANTYQGSNQGRAGIIPYQVGVTPVLK